MKPLHTVAALVLVACSAGCMSPDIGIVDLKSGKILHPPHSEARQIVVSVNRETGTFTTLVRDGQSLVMRTFDNSCSRISERKLPLFSTSYCDTSFYAVSDDLQRLVYATGRPADLTLLDVSSGRDTVLQREFADSWGKMPVLTWIDQSTLLTVLREYPGSSRTTNEIALFNTTSREKKTLFNPVYPSSFDYALSSDRGFLAFRDGSRKHDIHGVIKIINLQTGVIAAQLGDGKHLIHDPSWSPDDSELAYVEGNSLNIWSRDKNTVRTVKTFPDDFICYDVVMGDGIIGYSGSKKSTPSRPLVILDSETGHEIRRVSAQFNGRIIPLDRGTVVCELGY